MTAKHTIDDMKALAAERGGRFLSTQYLGAKAKHFWKCSEGHQWQAAPAGIKEGKWCPKCATKKRIEALSLTIDDMKALARERGGRFLSLEYLGMNSKHAWECAEGHQWETAPSHIQQGSWCPVCSRDKAKLTIDDMKALAKERGGHFLSQEYLGTRARHLWKCSEGHEWEAAPLNIKNNLTWCPTCAGNTKLTIDDMKALAAERGGRFLSKVYLGSAAKHFWKCSEGHEWEAAPDSIQRGRWCPRCLKKGETMVLETVEQLMETPSTSGIPGWLKKYLGKNSRKILVDGWFEEAGLVVERNGRQHYSYIPHFHRNGEKDFIKQVKRDQKLAAACVENKQFLLVVPFTDGGDPQTERETPMSEAATLALIERLAREQCLPFPLNPEFREMMAEAAGA